MAIVGKTKSKGFDIENAYINIGNISNIKVPFAEHEVQILFRLYKDQIAYESESSENENVLESIIIYLDGSQIDPSDYITEAYQALKSIPRFKDFSDVN